MFPTIWNTFDNFVDSAVGISSFLIVITFIVMLSFLIIPYVYGMFFNKKIKMELPEIFNVSIVFSNKNKKEHIIFSKTITKERAEKHNWDIIETDIPLLFAISIMLANKGDKNGND